jgi:hypothetical protein
MLTNGACVGMSIWRNQKKVRGFDIVCSIIGKVESSHLMVVYSMRTKVVLEDMGVGENGAKVQIALKYSPTYPKIRLWRKHLWVGGLGWGKGIEFELVAKAWACKENSSYKFFQSLIRKCLSQIRISLCPITPPWRGKVKHHWGNKKSKCQVATS